MVLFHSGTPGCSSHFSALQKEDVPFARNPRRALNAPTCSSSISWVNQRELFVIWKCPGNVEATLPSLGMSFRVDCLFRNKSVKIPPPQHYNKWWFPANVFDVQMTPVSQKSCILTHWACTVRKGSGFALSMSLSPPLVAFR